MGYFTVRRLEATTDTVCERRRVPNTTCVESHERIVDGLKPATPPAPPIRSIAVGESAQKASEGDRSLTGEITRVPVVGYDATSTSVTAIAIVDSSTANGFTIRELAAYAGAEKFDETLYFLNHSILDQGLPKTSDDRIEITVTLTFSAR